MAALPGDRPVYGIRARGLDEDGERDTTVEDMAESAIDSMRLVQPGGTYTLVGSSFGGLVAHEVAHRLLASGMDVDVVLLVDSYLDNGVLSPSERRRFVLWERPLQWARWLLDASPSRVRDLVARARRLVVRGRDEPHVGTPVTTRQQDVMTDCYEAMGSYRPPPLACRVVYVRADVRFANKCEPIRVWARLTEPERFRVIQVPGRHGQTLVDPVLHDLLPQLAPLFR